MCDNYEITKAILSRVNLTKVIKQRGRERLPATVVSDLRFEI